MKLFEKKNTLEGLFGQEDYFESVRQKLSTEDEKEQQERLEKAAIAIACAFEKKSTDDIMLPQLVSMSKSKGNHLMLFEMENHQFLQMPRKYRINVCVEEVKS